MQWLWATRAILAPCHSATLQKSGQHHVQKSTLEGVWEGAPFLLSLPPQTEQVSRQTLAEIWHLCLFACSTDGRIDVPAGAGKQCQFSGGGREGRHEQRRVTKISARFLDLSCSSRDCWKDLGGGVSHY